MTLFATPLDALPTLPLNGDYYCGRAYRLTSSRLRFVVVGCELGGSGEQIIRLWFTADDTYIDVQSGTFTFLRDAGCIEDSE